MVWKRLGKVSSLVLGLGMLALSASCMADVLPRAYVTAVPVEVSEDVLTDLVAVEADIMELRATVNLLEIRVSEFEARPKPKPRRRVAKRKIVCPLFGF